MTSINPNISINPFKPQGVNNKKDTELGIFYTNDMHGDVTRLAKFKSAHDTFKLENKTNPSMTLAAGDCLFGADKQRNSLMVKLFNLMHLDALALGNHEFAGGSKPLADSLDKADFKSVCCNLKIDEDSPLKERLKDKKLVKSAVFMKGGHKFAVIGTAPIDSYIGKNEGGVKPLGIDNTIKEINEETKKLESQGINKIILCSHLGYGEQGDLKVARETEGIDIIVGGHTHTVIDGVNTQDNGGTHKLNLLMSKRNEPVIITQAGGMNQYAGYLDVVFDKNGVLKTDKIKNNLYDLNIFKDSRVAKNLMDKELGKKVVLAETSTDYTPKDTYEERFKENPLANLYADAVKEQTGADVVLYHAATIRGGVKGAITNYDVKYSMLPFNNDMKQIEISEKDLVDVINAMAGSLLTTNSDPQVLRCAGMNYTIHNDVEFAKTGNKNSLIDLKIGDENVNVENPSEDKKLKLTLNEYLFKHDLTKNILAKYENDAKSVGHEQDLFINYLDSHKNIDLKQSEEKRTNFTQDYATRDEFNAARKEVIGETARYI